ncbi:expressed conserved protein [Echinococcus multilocularis]|uniref:Expressed conserved protein n=1 Tax=Echinococcus multilocularis TaxID=6211 RepID=A0A087W0A2_ECHMU|nr:expressed conserved protein [Echinococcus multilocularis]
MDACAREAIVLWGVALLNILAFVKDGWPCGKIYSQVCLRTSNAIPLVVNLLLTAIGFSLIAAIVETVALFLGLISKSSHKLLFISKVLICLVANLDLFIIFFYYNHLTVRFWSHIIIAVCAGMALAIAIIKFFANTKGG